MMKFMFEQEVPFFLICYPHMSQSYLSNLCWCLYTLISLNAEVLKSVKQEMTVHEINALIYNTI